METEDLVALLADEHPQTVALVLSHLPADQAAEALGAMPPELQAPLVRRIAAIDEPSAEIIRDVEEAIRRRLSGAGSTGDQHRHGQRRQDARRHAAGQPSGGCSETSRRPTPDLLGDIRRAMFGADVAGCETACEAASG